jgi:hypothetical protein
MDKPLAVQVFEAMSCALENYRNVEAGQAIIDAALAEREAQSVQREREKVKGLEKQLEDALFLISELEATAAKELDSARAALDTYNDNRKG